MAKLVYLGVLGAFITFGLMMPTTLAESLDDNGKHYVDLVFIICIFIYLYQRILQSKWNSNDNNFALIDRLRTRYKLFGSPLSKMENLCF